MPRMKNINRLGSTIVSFFHVCQIMPSYWNNLVKKLNGAMSNSPGRPRIDLTLSMSLLALCIDGAARSR